MRATVARAPAGQPGTGSPGCARRVTLIGGSVTGHSLAPPGFPCNTEIGFLGDFFTRVQRKAPVRQGNAVVAGGTAASGGPSCTSLTLRDCMIAASHTAGLDVQGISAEAALALEAWPSGNRDVIDVMFAPPSVPPATDATRLDSRDRDALIEALGAGSDWLAGIACDLLLHARDPRVAERAARRVQEVAANRRASAVMVAIANDPDPAQVAARFLAASDPPVRVGAAAAIKALAQAGAAGPWNGLLTRALADDDQTVRLAAGADPAEIGQEGYWSCDECGHTNEVDAPQCGNCGEEGHIPIYTDSGKAFQGGL